MIKSPLKETQAAPVESPLTLGNRALRAKDYALAISNYIAVLQATPALGKTVAGNLAMARQKYRAERDQSERQRVAVCGWELAHNAADRVYTLAKIYETFAYVEIIGTIFPNYGKEVWGAIRSISIPHHTFIVKDESRFIDLAIELVAAHPYDIVHLSNPRAPNIFFGILYKLIWDAKVLMDVDNEELAIVGADSPMTFDDYIKANGNPPELKQLDGIDWTRIAVGLVNEFDGITVANPALQKLYGGKLIHNQIEVAKVSKKEVGFGGLTLIHNSLVALKPLVSDKENLFLDCKGKVFDVSHDPGLVENIEISSANKKSCMVRLENVSLKSATGWALCLENKNDRVFLNIQLNNKSLHIVDTYKLRNDVKNTHGGEGYVGYHAELNEYLDYSGCAEISVEPISHVVSESEKTKNVKKKLPLLLKGQHFVNVNLKAKLLSEKYFFDLEKKHLNKRKDFFVSIIVLNLNGLNVLKRCLQSIYKNTFCDFEVIVIDHGSTDGSIEFLKATKFRNLISIFREKNYSFSASNNFAAREAKGDILIFMNNDMIVVDDAVSAIARTVVNSPFGLVGLKLWDMPQWLPVEISMSLNVVQHVGVHFHDTHRENIIDAFETRPGTFWLPKADFFETPAVTAAMMGIKKSEFFDVGGFDEEYFYGQEDVDFCLKYMKANLRKSGVLLSHGAYHARGLSRRVLSNKSGAYIQNNRVILQEKLGGWFRRRFREEQLDKSGYWNSKPYSFAMIVSDIGFETERADYFTARELGDAIEEDSDAVVGYFSTEEKIIDVSGYDCIIIFIDGFDPSRLINIGPSTLLIAWARNWFDRWCERAWIHMYDLIFSSSEFSRKYMEDTLQRKVGLLRIAASRSCVKGLDRTKKYESDYCFTGSYFNSPREITSFLDPSNIPFVFKLFGHNWENHPQFGKYTNGPVSYAEIPSIYASTKLVVDDANIATKKWGAVNCRVYDALAAGTMCISNNVIGNTEIFGGDFPIFTNKNELNKQIRDLLGNDVKRLRLMEKLKKVVLEKHTYSHRVIDLFDAVREKNKKIRIAIKIAAPSLEKSKPWGDLYFAISLRKHFEKEGYQTRIDCMDQWNSSRALGDDVVIVLRGLDRYKPQKNQLNILWLISHPNLVCEAELSDYDKIYVASEHHATQLINFTGFDNIEYLPQATDFTVEQLDPEKLEKTPRHEILFIGNSRGYYREVVRWCVEEQLPITVYGQGWEEFIPRNIIAADHIDNKDIPYFYKNAKVVLNDHWPDMRRSGFISNRVWDVLGSGGVVLSDFVVGMEAIKNNKLLTFSEKNSFIDKLGFALSSTSCVAGLNTIDEITPFFSSRAEKILAYIKGSFDKEKKAV